MSNAFSEEHQTNEMLAEIATVQLPSTRTLIQLMEAKAYSMARLGRLDEANALFVAVAAIELKNQELVA